MKIAILHLSDFHIKEKDELILMKIDKMFDALNVLGKVDEYVIIFSGDLAHSGKINEYKKSRKVIGKIIAGLKTKSSKAFVDLWMVPGNHDLDISTAARTKDDIKNHYDKKTLSTILDSEYSLLNNYYTISHSNVHNWHDKLLSKRFSTYGKEYTIQYNLINTAPFSTLGYENNMLHYFPNEKMSELKKQDSANICITVMHHNHLWFYWEYQNDLEKAIINNSEFLFLGHDHTEKTKNISIDNSQETWVSCAGQMNFSDVAFEDSFNVIVIETEQNSFSGYIFNWIQKESMYKSKMVIDSKPIQVHSNQLTPLPSFVKELKSDTYTSTEDFTTYFVFPKLTHEINNKFSKTLNISTQEEANTFIRENKRIIVIGSSNSGKTTLLKHMFLTMHDDIVPLVLLVDSSTRINTKNFIKRLFEDQYGEDSLLFEKYRQLDKSKKAIFIDGWDRFSDSNAQTKLSEILEDNFEYIILSSNIPQKDIIKKVKDEIDDSFPFKELRIKPFFQEKRNQLVKNICVLNTTYNDEDIIKVNKLIDSLVSNNHNLFSFDPAFIISYTDYFTREKICDYTTGEATFSKVFEHGINSSILKYAKKSDIDELITVFEELASYIYNNHKDILSIAEFKNVIEDYKMNYDVSISTDTVLEVSLKSKLIRKTSDLSLYFSNKNYLAYFIAKYLYRTWQNSGDMSGIENALKNICFGINSDIILFLTYLTNNTKIVMSIAKYAGDLLSPWQELDFDRNSFSYLKATGQKAVSAPTQTEHDSIKAKREKNEEKLSRQYDIEAKGLFDYDEAEIDNFEYRLNRAITYTEMICKSLPAFNNLLIKEQKNNLVELIYSYPQKIIFALLEPIEKNIDELCDLIIAFANEAGATLKGGKQYSKQDVLYMIDAQSRSLILGLSDHFAELSVSAKSYDKLMSKDTNTINRAIFKLLLLENSGNTDEFVKLAETMLKSNKNESIRYMIRMIARKHILCNPELPYNKKQSIIDKFLESTAKNDVLFLKK